MFCGNMVFCICAPATTNDRTIFFMLYATGLDCIGIERQTFHGQPSRECQQVLSITFHMETILLRAALLLSLVWASQTAFTTTSQHDYGWAPGHATYYGGSDAMGTNGGACGYQDVFALGFGAMTAAVSDMIYDRGLLCGACFEVRCNGDTRCFQNSVVVTVTNQSPQWSTASPGPHFDLAQPAFNEIGQEIAGHFDIEYRRVFCQKRGGILFFVGGQDYWMSVLPYNVGGPGDVSALAVKGEKSAWIGFQRIWGQTWTTGAILSRQSISFSVTASDGNTLVSWNVANRNWRYGQTFEGAQF